MSDLNAKIVADLKRELAEARAERDKLNADLAGVEAALIDAGVPPLGNLGKRVADIAFVRDREQKWAMESEKACKELEAARAEIEQQRKLTEEAKEELRAQCVPLLRRELEQQRTRAEAAEQEAREERMRADDLLLVVKHCHASSTHAATMRGLNPAVGSLLHDAGKLAAIRAHLPALKRLHAWVSSERMGEWTYLEGGTFYDDVQEMAAVVADALEALEP